MTSAEDIADGVVTLLNGLATDIAFVAERPVDVPELDRAIDDATVQVYPFEETEDSQTHTDHMLLVTRVVKVIVQCPLGQRTRADCIAWLNQLKDGFRASIIGDCRWDKNTTDTLYDFDAIKTKQQFLSVFSATYYGFI